MKKFSTAALVVALASLTSNGFAADKNSSSGCSFLDNAPDQHVVVRGDTLWDISGKFLKNAWCWPTVWGMNKDQIRDAHWIYPGQIIYFDRVAGRLRLGAPSANDTFDVRLQPRMRAEQLARSAVAAIPSNAIEPFLNQPLAIEKNALDGTPRIVATQEGRFNIAKGDKAYVLGDLKGGATFQVFRPGTPLKDPQTGEILGYEAAYLGSLKLERASAQAGEAHTFSVVESKQEIGVGDRLLPAPPAPILNYMPHAPEKMVDGRIVSVYGGVNQAGQNQIVSLNRGARDGINIGTVLSLSRAGKVVVDKTLPSTFAGDKPTVKLPEMVYGNLFVFRVFDTLSYGLVMEVREPVQIGDTAKSPE